MSGANLVGFIIGMDQYSHTSWLAAGGWSGGTLPLDVPFCPFRADVQRAGICLPRI